MILGALTRMVKIIASGMHCFFMKKTNFYFIFCAEGSIQDELQTRGQLGVVLINIRTYET